MQNMDWDDLRCFLAVQQGGSVSAAARQLAVNHSTVLRRLGRLEAVLAVRLFDRRNSGYLITPAGEALASELAGLGEQIETAQRRLMGQDRAIRGTIRLTSTDTLFASLLTPLLAEFRALYPEVTLELVMSNHFMRLTRREADVAVRGTNQPPDQLLGRCAGRIRTAPYASRSYLDSLPLGASWQDGSWVAPDEALGHLAQARWLAKAIPAAQVVARSDSLVGMLQCVRAGMGTAMLLCPLADDYPELVQLAPASPELDTEIWILAHPDMRQVARVGVLTQFLHSRLSADPRLQPR
ncbi:LysR family transcriptional regulator [Chitinimonas sp.]|uniref:LysR family transcriptional regulator n=1 Tax=Chitinimonas sp. TaxID=1934313 RepID=UPI002F9569FE